MKTKNKFNFNVPEAVKDMNHVLLDPTKTKWRAIWRDHKYVVIDQNDTFTICETTQDSMQDKANAVFIAKTINAYRKLLKPKKAA